MIKTAGDFIAEARTRIETLDATSARKLYDESNGAVILDVREPGELEKGSLPQAMHVVRGLLEMKVPGLITDPATVVLTHCGGGGRACLSAARLAEMGYTRVYAITDTFENLQKAFA